MKRWWCLVESKPKSYMVVCLGGGDREALGQKMVIAVSRG